MQILDDSKTAEFQSGLVGMTSELFELEKKIKLYLNNFSDGKNLKGQELVGWLGEIYCKLFFDGRLVEDSNEHDFITKDGFRYSVKARKGFSGGWNESSTIPKIEGKESPTHLIFIHFNDNYSIDRLWLYEWNYLLTEVRLKPKKSRNQVTGWKFRVRDKKDAGFLKIDNRI